MSDAKQDLDPAEESTTAQDPPPTWLEWSARAVSAVLIVGLIGYLVQAGLGASDPAEFGFNVVQRDVRQAGGHWVLPVEIANQGDVSVADLAVTVELMDGDAVVTSEAVTVPLLGRGASANVEFWLGADPSRHEVRFEVGSYLVP